MRISVWAVGISCLMLSTARAQQAVSAEEKSPFKPVNLSLQPAAPESIYAPPSPSHEGPGINEGAVHFDLSLAYMTDYVYRGIEIFEPPGAEDRPNVQIDSKLSFDLGKLPHPFIEVFVNYADSDPVSSFQEIRPSFGAEWSIRPLVLSAGHTTYLYQNRDTFNTSEIWGKIQIDDSYFLHSRQPMLSPYVYGAYDYDLYNGWYMEAGVSHDFVIEDTGLVITANAHVSYVRGIQLFAADPLKMDVNGFQHYQLGLIGTYSLNSLMHFSTRYGKWSIQGFVNYTDGLDNSLRANTQVWGGAGILFQY